MVGQNNSSAVCRYHAFAAPIIRTIQQLQPSNNCKVREPGEDDDFCLALEDLERLQPTQLLALTQWLERQVADMGRLIASPVGNLAAMFLSFAPAFIQCYFHSSQLGMLVMMRSHLLYVQKQCSVSNLVHLEHAAILLLCSCNICHLCCVCCCSQLCIDSTEN